MKNIISEINKAFDHRVRLGIMSVLMVNEYADFTSLKELLGVTDGNIASHIKATEAIRINLFFYHSTLKFKVLKITINQIYYYEN